MTASWLPTMVPPNIGVLGSAYVNALDLGPNGPRAGTKLPGPDDDPELYDEVTIRGFIRVEEIGIVPENPLEFDCDWAVHAYHPDEEMANWLCTQVSIQVGNAQGGTYTAPQHTLPNGVVVPASDWYVGWSRVVVTSQPSTDPTVDLPRFRSMVTWRVPGHEL